MKLIKQLIKQAVIGMMDEYGLLPHTQGNKINTTSEFYHLCSLRGLLDEEDITRWHNAIYALQLEPGLFRRYPKPPESYSLEQHDNMIAIACAFQDYAKDITNYGLRHWFHYASRPPLGFKEWFSCFRSPYQICLFALCSGWLYAWLWLPLLPVLWITIIIEAFKPRENTSGKLLIWQLKQHGFWVLWLPFKVYEWKLKKTHGEKYTEDLFKIYYHEGSGMELLAAFAGGL